MKKINLYYATVFICTTLAIALTYQEPLRYETDGYRIGECMDSCMEERKVIDSCEDLCMGGKEKNMFSEIIYANMAGLILLSLILVAVDYAK